MSPVMRLGLRPNLIQFSLLVAVNALVGGMVGQRLEAGDTPAPGEQPSNGTIFVRTSFTEPALSSACQAGLGNNLNFGLSWGLFPLLFSAAGLGIERIGALVAVYPAVWGAAQILTGALSDRWGRKRLITAGMLTQAIALAFIASGRTFGSWLAAAALLGIGTALVYPTLLAVIGDVAHPLWRARSVGVYRLGRDSGYACGAVVGGEAADLWGFGAAVWAAAGITALSAVVVAVPMYETHRPITARASPG